MGGVDEETQERNDTDPDNGPLVAAHLLCFCEPANLYVAIHSDPDGHPDTVDYEQEEDGVADVREKHTERVAGLDRGH